MMYFGVSELGPIIFNVIVIDKPQSPQCTKIDLFAGRRFNSLRWIPLCRSKSQQPKKNCPTLLSKWCKRWKIQINASKSTAVMFGLRRCSAPKFENEFIPRQPSVKDHGLTSDNKLTWWPHTCLQNFNEHTSASQC